MMVVPYHCMSSQLKRMQTLNLKATSQLLLFFSFMAVRQNKAFYQGSFFRQSHTALLHLGWITVTHFIMELVARPWGVSKSCSASFNWNKNVWAHEPIFISLHRLPLILSKLLLFVFKPPAGPWPCFTVAAPKPLLFFSLYMCSTLWTLLFLRCFINKVGKC